MIAGCPVEQVEYLAKTKVSPARRLCSHGADEGIDPMLVRYWAFWAQYRTSIGSTFGVYGDGSDAAETNPATDYLDLSRAEPLRPGGYRRPPPHLASPTFEGGTRCREKPKGSICHFTSEQILPSGFAEQRCRPHRRQLPMRMSNLARSILIRTQR